MERERERQGERDADRQTGRQTHTHRHTHIHIHTQTQENTINIPQGDSISVTGTAEDANIDLTGLFTPEASEAPSKLVEQSGPTVTTEMQLEAPSTPQKAPEPDVMPEKFASTDDPQAALLKSYLELQKQMGAPTPQTPEDPGEPKVPEDAPAVNSNIAEDYTKKWLEQGQSLTDDQWSELSKSSGFPVEELRRYEASRKVEMAGESEAHEKAIYDATGGKESYDKMIEWANGAMTDGEIDSLNGMLDNPAMSGQAALFLKQRYEQVAGNEPSVTALDASNSLQGAVDMSNEITSDGEMVELMRDPKYQTSEIYRRGVDEKIERAIKRGDLA